MLYTHFIKPKFKYMADKHHGENFRIRTMKKLVPIIILKPFNNT